MHASSRPPRSVAASGLSAVAGGPGVVCRRGGTAAPIDANDGRMVPASMTAATTTLQVRERIFLTIDACVFMLKSLIAKSRDEERRAPP